MTIPNLTLVKDGGVIINPDFVDFNEYKKWSPERQIEVFWKLVKEHVYGNSDFSHQKIDKSMQAFNGAYGLVKLKFQDIKRNTGGRYFDHLIRVMQYLVISSKNPTIKRTIIAICHDLIEDTDISFGTLKEIFGAHIALGVLIITKKPTKEFIGDKKDFELFKAIERSGILNLKGFIGDEYLQRKTYFPESVTEEELYFESEYKKLERKYKQKVSIEYFSHIVAGEGDFFDDVEDIVCLGTHCLNKFYNYALLIAYNSDYKLNLSKEEIKQVCFDALEVKFWDRIDNLRTTEVYEDLNEVNINKAKRKIYETKTYFYKIAKEYDIIMNTDFFSVLFFEVRKLEEFISSERVKEILSQSKDDVGKILK